MNLEQLPAVKAATANLMQALEEAFETTDLTRIEREQELAFFIGGLWNRLESRVIAKGGPSTRRCNIWD